MESSASKLAKSLKKATNPKIGSKFPKVTAKSLAGNTLTLPEAAEGKVTLICIAFVRNAQSMIDSWLGPFEQIFGQDPEVTAYELPMAGPNWQFLSWLIDSGMRDGIPVEKHDHVLTIYEDYSEYQELLDMENTELAYIFLLDKKGIVRWKGQGHAAPEALMELIETTKYLL